MVQPRAQREIEERAMPFFTVMTRDRQKTIIKTIIKSNTII